MYISLGRDKNKSLTNFNFMQVNFQVRDKETGTVIEDCATYEEAVKLIAQYEELDRADGNYTPDFYEVYSAKTSK